MVWICDQCKYGQHNRCENEWQCDCQCNINGGADVAQKLWAIGSGTILAVGGLAFTLCTGGLGAVIVGGAMLGAGISSAWNGAEKAIKQERMDGKSYAADVVFGAVTGVVTGGIGAAGETVAANVAKQGAKQAIKAGVTKAAVRTTTGAVAGVTSKAIDEVKQCSTTDKSWSDYGKSFNKDGHENGTTASWIMSVAVGGLGGASTHVSSNVTKSISSNAAQSITRVAVSSTTAAISDATMQTVNIAVGNQAEYDIKRTVTSTTTSAIMTAAQEGTKNAFYAAKGGKNNLLNDKSNRKAIKEKIPQHRQKEVVEQYKGLKKIPDETLHTELDKAKSYTQAMKDTNAIMEIEKPKHNEAIQSYDQQIKEKKELKNDAIVKKDISAIRQHQDQIKRLKAEKTTENKRFEDFEKAQNSYKQSGPLMMNEGNAHFLIGDHLDQVAVDIKSPGDVPRGVERAIFDYSYDKNGRTQFKLSDYTDEHNYKGMNTCGKSNFNDIYQKFDNQLNRDLTVTQGEVNTLVCNRDIEDEKKERKGSKVKRLIMFFEGEQRL